MEGGIKVVSLDPSISNCGIAVGRVDPATLEYDIDDLLLVKTATDSKLGKSDDDLRRCQEIVRVLNPLMKDAVWGIAEFPQIGGAQMQARSIWTSGIMFGTLAAMPVDWIRVTPIDVKKLSVGKKTATKEEMIAWAMEKFPKAPWKTRKYKGEIEYTSDNEHLADAVAALHAGLQSPVVKQALKALTFIRKQD